MKLLLTVQHAGGCSFCEPIGHRQESGDYQESWQPQSMSDIALENRQKIAEKVTRRLEVMVYLELSFSLKATMFTLVKSVRAPMIPVW